MVLLRQVSAKAGRWRDGWQRAPAKAGKKATRTKSRPGRRVCVSHLKTRPRQERLEGTAPARDSSRLPLSRHLKMTRLCPFSCHQDYQVSTGTRVLVSQVQTCSLQPSHLPGSAGLRGCKTFGAHTRAVLGRPRGGPPWLQLPSHLSLGCQHPQPVSRSSGPRLGEGPGQCTVSSEASLGSCRASSLGSPAQAQHAPTAPRRH